MDVNDWTVIINDTVYWTKDEEETKRFIWLFLVGGYPQKIKIIPPKKNPEEKA